MLEKGAAPLVGSGGWMVFEQQEQGFTALGGRKTLVYTFLEIMESLSGFSGSQPQPGEQERAAPVLSCL